MRTAAGYFTAEGAVMTLYRFFQSFRSHAFRGHYGIYIGSGKFEEEERFKIIGKQASTLDMSLLTLRN